MKGRIHILVLVALLGGFSAFAQPGEASYRIWFAVSSFEVNPRFSNNRDAMDGIASLLQSLSDRGVDTVYVSLHSFCSPEGRADLNKALARNRGLNVQTWMQSLEGIPALSFQMEMSLSTWLEVKEKSVSYFRRCDIALSYDVPAPVPTGLTPEPDKALNPETILEEIPETDVPLEARATTEVMLEPVVPAEKPWAPSWYLKTNLLTYPLNLTANAAVEVEVGRHFSLSIPFYYSAMNWFRSDIKFRVCGSQPELRYWFGQSQVGLFAAVHLTFGWYNIALGGRYRYQDHSTSSPVIGGGVTAGWRLPLGRSRWAVEFTLGAGYLPLYYDTFYNVENGALAQEGLWKHYWGPDNAAVSFSYRFGKRRVYE